jgi:spoIIIJ-associated protein
VEWVETTGKSVEEAKEHALDELGVDDQDAEFEIMEEPKAGLFGLVRKEARVRARVRPTQPRPKVERRRTRRRDGAERGQRNGSGAGSTTEPDSDTSGGGDNAPDEAPQVAKSDTNAKSVTKKAASGRSRGGRSKAPAASVAAATKEAGTKEAKTKDAGTRQAGTRQARTNDDRDPAGTAGGGRSKATKENEEPMDEITLDQQVEVMEDFLDGLVEAFGLDGQVSSENLDDDTVEISIEGGDLGLLIGPKGQTLAAVQELARTVAQRRLAGPHQGRVRLDVSGYRKRRAEALTRFALQVAADVKESGTPKVLEPMSPPDRKVVHDALNDFEGVHTASEGEDSRRRVVVLPD